MITIGETKIATRRPSDLDAAVTAVAGLSAAEMATQLGGYPRPQIAAQALHPFTDGALSVPEIAALIAGADAGALQAEVAKLYVQAGAESASGETAGE